MARPTRSTQDTIRQKQVLLALAGTVKNEG